MDLAQARAIHARTAAIAADKEKTLSFREREEYEKAGAVLTVEWNRIYAAKKAAEQEMIGALESLGWVVCEGQLHPGWAFTLDVPYDAGGDPMRVLVQPMYD